MSDEGARCETCRAWDRPSETCRRRAAGERGWPEVGGSAWCLEWEGAPESSTALRDASLAMLEKLMRSIAGPTGALSHFWCAGCDATWLPREPPEHAEGCPVPAFVAAVMREIDEDEEEEG